MNDHELTDEEERDILEGADAQTLLDDPIFLRVVDRLRAQCAEAILTSEPTDFAGRENTYNLSRGLSAVTVELLAIAAKGTTVMDNATRPNASTPVHDLDHDSGGGDY